MGNDFYRNENYKIVFLVTCKNMEALRKKKMGAYENNALCGRKNYSNSEYTFTFFGF